MPIGDRVEVSGDAGVEQRLEVACDVLGVGAGEVVEQALLFFMKARRELPDEALIPSRVVLSDETFDRVARVLDDPPPELPQAPAEPGVSQPTEQTLTVHSLLDASQLDRRSSGNNFA